MDDPRAEFDRIAAELVRAAGSVDCLAAFVRWENGEARIIAPAGLYPQLARLFYRAADVCAAQAPLVKR